MLSKAQVKYIQSLNQKKLREREGVFVAEGPKILNELLAEPGLEPLDIYATSVWLDEHLEKVPARLQQQVHTVTADDLDRISSLKTPNQVLGVFRKPAKQTTFHFTPLTLVLDGIQDPGNMGTILRIADWFGIGEVVASEDSADVFNTKVVQASMGSIARVDVVYDDLQVFVAANRKVPVYAATLHGTPLATFEKTGRGMLLVGNESKGIQEALLEMATHRVTIPRAGRAESLNAAVATGIILSHLL